MKEKRMKAIGSVEIPQEAIMSVLKMSGIRTGIGGD